MENYCGTTSPRYLFKSTHRPNASDDRSSWESHSKNTICMESSMVDSKIRIIICWPESKLSRVWAMEQMRNQPSILMCLCAPPVSTQIMLKECQAPSFRVCNAPHVSRNQNRRTSKPQLGTLSPDSSHFPVEFFYSPCAAVIQTEIAILLVYLRTAGLSTIFPCYSIALSPSCTVTLCFGKLY